MYIYILAVGWCGTQYCKYTLCLIFLSEFAVTKMISTLYLSTEIHSMANLKNLKAVAKKCSVKSVLRNYAKFTGKHLWQSLFFNKASGLKVCVPFLLSSICRYCIYVEEGTLGLVRSTRCFLVLPTIHNLKKTKTISHIISETFFIKNST